MFRKNGRLIRLLGKVNRATLLGWWHSLQTQHLTSLPVSRSTLMVALL